MPIRIDNPRELGADRLVNAVAAYERLGGAVHLVDFGTAVNFDVVSRRRASTSAASSPPGVEISLDALTARGAKLPQIDLVAPRRADRQGDGRRDPLGRRLRLRRRRSTAIVGRMQEELGEEARDDRHRRPGRPSCPHTHAIDEVDDLLTLKGLKLLHERNASARAG